MELLIVALMVVLVLMFVFGTNYFTQIQKAQDAKQKADLNTLQKILEEYHVDHGVYPAVSDLTYVLMGDTDNAGKLCGTAKTSTTMQNYIGELPCNKKSPSEDYVYFVEKNAQEYAIFTLLANEADPSIEEIGCLYGCSYYLDSNNPGNSLSDNYYNYYVASPGYDFTQCYSSTNFWACYPGRSNPNERCKACTDFSCTQGYSTVYCQPDWCLGECRE